MTTNLLEKMYARREPQGQILALSKSHVAEDVSFDAEARPERVKYASLSKGSNTEYIVVSMQPIGHRYTERVLADGAMIRDKLKLTLAAHQFRVEFDYQGSVTNQTHVKWRSDLDLLVVDRRCTILEYPQKPVAPYEGEPVNDLKELRSMMVRTVRAAYPDVIVNQHGGKSVSLVGGALAHKIDLVVCNWWNTNDYKRTNDKRYRGIYVLNLDSNEQVRNKPFLHNDRLSEKDVRVAGGLRKVIRLLKSIKYDCEIPLSSYDIASIAYHMEEGMLSLPKGKELLLAENALKYLKSVHGDDELRDSLWVPNKMRKVFCADGACQQSLGQLIGRLELLLKGATSEPAVAGRTIKEASVQY